MAARITQQQARDLGLLPKASPRTKAVDADGMNRTERRYADLLSGLQASGRLKAFAFEPLKLRLAGRTFLTPDFTLWLPDGRLILDDVKGHLEDDAAVKLKVAAEAHPWFTLRIVSWEGGAWRCRPVTRRGIARKEDWSL